MPTRTPYIGNVPLGDALASSELNNGPGGWYGWVERDTNATTTATTQQTNNAGLSVTPSVPADRLIRIEFRSRGISRDSTGTVLVGLFEDGTLIADAHAQITAVGVAMPLAPCWVVRTPAAGSRVYTVGFWNAVGTGTATLSATSTSEAQLLVQDLGAAA